MVVGNESRWVNREERVGVREKREGMDSGEERGQGFGRREERRCISGAATAGFELVVAVFLPIACTLSAVLGCLDFVAIFCTADGKMGG